MKVLIACEESQRVCLEFRKLGHEAYSCDPFEFSGQHPEWHIFDDVLNHLNDGWDMMIAFPPCTYLSNAGIRWFNEERYGERAKIRKLKRLEAFNFVLKLANAPIPKICIENPVGWLNSHWRKPDQIIQPYQFGEPDSKRTCLWLKNLPKLKPTEIVKPRIYGYYKKGKKKGEPIYFHDSKFLNTNKENLSVERSKTFPGIAKAMAEQWG